MTYTLVALASFITPSNVNRFISVHERAIAVMYKCKSLLMYTVRVKLKYVFYYDIYLVISNTPKTVLIIHK